jgi:hypothetical protein
MGGFYLKELKTLTVIALIISIIVALSAFFIFQIPEVYSVVLGISSGMVFFFIILWSSYVFVFH